MRAQPREGIVASCLWTPVSGVGMYASLAAKAKVPVNRRGCAVGGGVRVAATQAVQTLGEQCGGLSAPLCRPHARRVESLEGCHGGPA